MICKHCGSSDTYLFAIINGQDVYDCKYCNKRTVEV